MNTYFPIEINDETLMVKKLNLKNYCLAFEIWGKDIIQFIIVHDINRSENNQWKIDYDRSRKVNRAYIDKIVIAIDFHYANNEIRQHGL